MAKRRRFILDLAVRGKLVEQRPSNEHARDLLAEIQEKKAARWALPRRPHATASQNRDQYPFQVPPNWLWTHVGDVSSNRMQMLPDAPFRYVDVSSIDKEAGRIANPKVLIPEEAPSRARKIVERGDVLYSCVRPNLLNVAVVERQFEPRAIASTAFAVIDGLGLMVPRYLWIVLRSPFMIAMVEARMRGQAYPAINDSDFALLPLPLPPVVEQTRIVTKVNELLVVCDRLESAQAEREVRRNRAVASSNARLNAPSAVVVQRDAQFHSMHLSRLTLRHTHVDALRDTIVRLGLRGKLVPQDQTDEPAHCAIERAAAARTGRAWTDDRASNVQEAFPAPAGWAWTRIAATVQRVTVGYVGPMKEQYVERGIPFLRSQNVRPNRFRPDGLIAISPTFHKSIIKSALSPGDVVVVRSGNVGTACVIPASLPEANCSDLVIVKKPLAVVPQFLSYYLNSLAKGHVEAGTVGVALTHFHTKSVATMPLPLPPISEQHRIVAKLDDLMSLCDRLEGRIADSEVLGSRVLDALLHETLASLRRELADQTAN